MKTKTTHTSNIAGYSLVELMITISLSLFLSSGVIHIFTNNKHAFQHQHQMAQLYDNIRIAVEFLQRDIRMAGYRQTSNSTPNSKLLNEKFSTQINYTYDGKNQISDAIAIRYQAERDCLGSKLTHNKHAASDGYIYAVNKYFIRKNTLMCLGNGNKTAQPIVNGVENMQILYGESNDTIISASSGANYYVPFSQANMEKVVSVKIALLFRMSEATKSDAKSIQYPLLDNLVFSPKDKIHRQTFVTTIALRNKDKLL